MSYFPFTYLLDYIILLQLTHNKSAFSFFKLPTTLTTSPLSGIFFVCASFVLSDTIACESSERDSDESDREVPLSD